MSEPRTGDDGFAPWARGWGATVALVLGVLVLRWAYLAWFSPYALIEDEAFYWLWSQHPAWSYYTKGPGIAWAIGVSTAMLGDTEFGVRAMAPVFASVLALVVAALARDVMRDGRAGFIAAALVTLAPGLAMAPLLMTIDVPYMACWAVAAWAGWRAASAGWGARSGSGWWTLCGLALGVGFLFKYTILLLVPGIVVGVIVAVRARRSEGARGSWGVRGAIAGAMLFVLCAMPVVIWNIQHGWPTVRHLLGHLGMRGGDMARVERVTGWCAPIDASVRAPAMLAFDPRWTLEFVGIQLALAGPALLLVPLGLCGLGRLDARARAGRLFLLWCALPIGVFYLLVTLKAEAEGNWALGALVTLLALGAIGALEGLDRQRARARDWLAIAPSERPRWGKMRRRPETWGQILWDWSVGVGVVVTLVGARADLVARVPVVGDRVPIGRLVVGRTLAADVAPLVAGLRDAGSDSVIVIGQHYGRSAQLSFYLPRLVGGDLPVLCASSRLGGRTTDFDFWEDVDVDDPRWRGADAVCVGATPGQWADVFDSVEDVGPLAGDHKRRTAMIGRGFRGFAGAPWRED